MFFIESQTKKSSTDKFSERGDRYISPTRPIHWAASFLVKHNIKHNTHNICVIFWSAVMQETYWRITLGILLRKLDNTVSRNVRYFRPFKRCGSKYGSNKQSQIKRCGVLNNLSLVTCGLSKVHGCELCVLQTPSRKKDASAVKRTLAGKFGSMAVFWRNHWQHSTCLG